MVAAAISIDPGDGADCRWAAIRHADDHIDIIATLIREDGRRPDHHRSGKRAQAECRLIEKELGLHRVAPGDRTAAKRAASAERHKAEREGRDRPAREELRETVRRAVAGVTCSTTTTTAPASGSSPPSTTPLCSSGSAAKHSPKGEPIRPHPAEPPTRAVFRAVAEGGAVG